MCNEKERRGGGPSLLSLLGARRYGTEGGAVLGGGGDAARPGQACRCGGSLRSCWIGPATNTLALAQSSGCEGAELALRLRKA